jgi:hypothetical protein
MATTIRSNAEFAAGNLVLLKHTLSLRENGLVSVAMSMACLGTEAVMKRNLALFGKDALPPVALPDNVKATPLINNAIYLADYQSRTETGVGYIDANYVGVSALGRTEYSESSNTKSFSGYLYANRFFNGNPVLFFFPWSFDYIASSVSISHCSFDAASRRQPEGRIEDRFNFKGGLPNVTDYYPSDVGRPYIKQVMATQISKIGPVYVINETANPELEQDSLEEVFRFRG